MVSLPAEDQVSSALSPYPTMVYTVWGRLEGGIHPARGHGRTRLLIYQRSTPGMAGARRAGDLWQTQVFWMVAFADSGSSHSELFVILNLSVFIQCSWRRWLLHESGWITACWIPRISWLANICPPLHSTHQNSASVQRCCGFIRLIICFKPRFGRVSPLCK